MAVLFKNKKKNNINNYLIFINEIICDDEIRNEIIGQIKRFLSQGTIIVDENNLTGKISNKENKLYLDIKYEKGKLICSYTGNDINSIVVVEQESIKSGNTRIVRNEKLKCNSHGRKQEYHFNVNEKIYNKENKLLYESENNINEELESYKDRIIYLDDSPSKNKTNIKKCWYISNGFIIVYELNKTNLHYKTTSEEKYLFCKDKGSEEFPIEKELFILFTTGEISEQELIENVERIKILKKKKAL